MPVSRLSNGDSDDNALSDLADKTSILVQFHLAHFAAANNTKEGMTISPLATYTNLARR